MISTRNLDRLPESGKLRRILQSFAMLDVILEAEWESRYYSFNAKWAPREQMGSMRNGSGDDFFALFSSAGGFLRGFDHECSMSPWRRATQSVWPGVLESVPTEFKDAATEPAFHMEDTTFCIWCRADQAGWARGRVEFPEGEGDPDGSEWMLSPLDGNPEHYRTFASEYYELDIPQAAIARVLAHEPLTTDLLAQFPTSRPFGDVSTDATEIGYPIAE